MGWLKNLINKIKHKKAEKTAKEIEATTQIASTDQTTFDKGLKKSEFAKQAGISAPTLAKLGKNETVSMDVIIRICRFFNCKMDDILDVLPETK